VLRGLEHLFAAEPDCEVLARCATGREALDAVRRHRPDILILGSRVLARDNDDMAVLRTLAGAESFRGTVVLAEGSEKELIREAVRLGARGVVLKEMPLDTLLQCVRRVHAGEYWLERRSASQAVEEMMRREAGQRAIAGRLTRRELEILSLLCRGLRDKEIAGSLSITEATAKTHVRHIYAKLHVNSRVALLRYADEQGLV
jgi:DNA-binding NarL/FixJ family response regulator